MGSGVCRTANGALITDASETLEVRGLGFTPTRVELIGAAPDRAIWHEPMPVDTHYKSVAAGTNTIVTTTGITPKADGFDIAAGMVDLNDADDEQTYWFAWE